jgi:phosphoribosylformimino-5-aminoimidazole carboxamide ribonucleotide (ProFAR) isomerase
MIVVPQLAFSASRIAAGDELPPVAIVRELVALGAREVQLLDLDGSLALEPVLPQWVEAIVAIAGVPVRFDGRLHDAHATELLTKARFGTLVVDHAALFDASLVRWALDLYGSRLCVEVQTDGEYLFDPPPHAFATETVDALSALHVQGVRHVLYRDVTARSIELARLQEVLDRVPGIELTYAGPVRSLSDVRRIASLSPRMCGCVVDAQLVLDGGIDLAAADASSSI